MAPRWKFWIGPHEENIRIHDDGPATIYVNRSGAYGPHWNEPTRPLPVNAPLLTRGQEDRALRATQRSEAPRG